MTLKPADEISIFYVRNLGPKSARWLEQAGIRTLADLQQIGPVGAYQMVRRIEPKVTLNLLWGLVAAVQDRDWRDLTVEEKQALKKVIL